MRIKKTSQTTPVQAEVVNVYSESTENTYGCDYINKALAEIYSTTEIKTNKVWIDGKPIYKRVVIAPVPNNGQQVVSFSGWNVEHAILDHGKSYHTLTNNNTVGLDFFYTSTDWSRFYINANGVYCNYGSSLSTKGNVTLFIEYTKATD